LSGGTVPSAARGTISRVPDIRRSAARAAVAALLAASLAGCGTQGDRTEVRGAVEAFLTALRTGDGRHACGQLSQDTVQQLVQQEQAPCEKAVAQLKLKPGPVTRVQVFVTNAKVDLASGESEFLDRDRAGWKLSAVGCEVQGKPADRPYDCQAEA
jgi:hypothetical protein